MTSKQQHISRLARSRQQVEDTLAAYQAAVKRRNADVRAAKADGMPAADAYRHAGITQSTFSRSSKEEGTD